MHIGIVSYDYDPAIGGLGILVRNITETVRKLHPEDRYTVLSPSGKSDEQVSALAERFFGKRGGCPLFSIVLHVQMKAMITKYGFDAVHAHAGSGGVFLLRKPSVPLIVTSHHTYLQEANYVFMYSPVKRLWKKFMSLLEKRTYSIADRIVCISKDTADFLIQEYGQDPKKISVIENAVPEIAEVSATERELETMLFIGRLEDRKGIWTLLDAARMLRSSHPNLRWRLIGKNLIGTRINRFIRKHSLEKSVALLGYVDEPLLQRELLSATALVVPSVLEGFGLVAASAMMAGTCVIASDAPGLRSIVRDGKTGMLFRSGSAESLSQTVKSLLKNPELGQRMEMTAREEAIDRFSFRKRAKDLHAVYREVLE